MRKIEQELFISISAISFICCVHACECCDLETHSCHSFSLHFPRISVSICCRDLSCFVQSNLSNKVLWFGSVMDSLQTTLPLCCSSRSKWVMIPFFSSSLHWKCPRFVCTVQQDQRTCRDKKNERTCLL